MHRRRFSFSAPPMSKQGASSKNGKVEQWITIKEKGNNEHSIQVSAMRTDGGGR